MEIKKHIGIIKNTGTRVIVVFREISEEDRENCLVVESDHLPEYYAQTMNEIVNSSEAQQTVNFYEVLNRRYTADGTNFLHALHSGRYLTKRSVDDIDIVPQPGKRVPLRMINHTIKPYPTIEEPSKLDQINVDELKRAHILNSVELQPGQDPILLAKSLYAQAEELEAQAKVRRMHARTIAPDYVPPAKKRGIDKMTPEEKALSNKAKNAKREMRRAQSKQDAALTAQVLSSKPAE